MKILIYLLLCTTCVYQVTVISKLFLNCFLLQNQPEYISSILENLISTSTESLHPMYRGPMVDYSKWRKHLIYGKSKRKPEANLHPEAERLLLWSNNDYEEVRKQLDSYSRLGCRVSSFITFLMH